MGFHGRGIQGCGQSRTGCDHRKGLHPKPSWAQAQPDGSYSTLGPQQKIEPPFVFEILCNCLTPGSILGQQETVVQRIKLHLCVHTGQNSQYLAAWLTFHMRHTSRELEMVSCSACAVHLHQVTSCLPTFAALQSRWK